MVRSRIRSGFGLGVFGSENLLSSFSGKLRGSSDEKPVILRILWFIFLAGR